MSSYIGLSRRKGGERRIWNSNPVSEHRDIERRHSGSNTNFFVLGNGGIDSFSAVCVLTLVLIAIIVTV